MVPVGFQGAQPCGAALAFLGGADGESVGPGEILACGGRGSSVLNKLVRCMILS